MSLEVAMKPVHPIKFDPKNLGDFDSPEWSKIGYDEVRHDLLNYYKICYDQIVRNASFNNTKDKEYNSPRSQPPNNCFSYATGMIATGDGCFRPAYLKRFDFSNADRQEAVFIPREISDEYKNQEELGSILAKGNILPVSKVPQETMENYTPIIAHITSYNVFNLFYNQTRYDYHFLKVDTLFHRNKPQVKILQKQSYSRPIAPTFTLEKFVQNYPPSTEVAYHDPKLYLCPKNFMNRHVHIHIPKDETYRHVILSDLKPK